MFHQYMYNAYNYGGTQSWVNNFFIYIIKQFGFQQFFMSIF